MAQVEKDPIQYIEELEEMFATQGWKNLTEEAHAQLAEYKDMALTLPTWERVCELRGQALQLARIINLPEMTAMLRQNVEAQEAEDEDDADF